MSILFEQIKIDLKSIYEKNHIESAKKLNQKLNKICFSEVQEPMYFTGKFDAKTVFVMLNPGNSIDSKYSFKKLDKEFYSDFDDYFNKHLKGRIKYGEKYDKDKVDAFDLKQAAFLYEFKNSGIDIPDFFSDDNNNKLNKIQAIKNVMLDKLQLEFVPYCSAEFNGFFDNIKLAEQNIKIFQEHLERVLYVLTEYDRNYIIWGAKQFFHIFYAYEKLYPGTIEFGEQKSYTVTELKKKVYSRVVNIRFNNKNLSGIIAYSFPRRDLPNAYKKMKQYGGYCWTDYVKF